MDLISRVKHRASNASTRTDEALDFPTEIGPKITDKEIAAIEAELELELPSTIRRIYTEIGDGGFGPGYGFLKMRGSGRFSDLSVVELYKEFREEDPTDPSWIWPKDLLLVTHWGCGIMTGVNCLTGRVAVYDPNSYQSDLSDSLFFQNCDIDEWLEKWCDGVNLWKELYNPDNYR